MINGFINFVERRLRIDANYFVRGGFWLSVGQGIALASGLVSTIVFSNVLAPNEFGIYKYILSLAAIFTAFSLTGMGQSILQTAARGYYFFFNSGIKIAFKFSIGIFLLGLAAGTYYYFQGNTTLSLGCILIALFVPIDNTLQKIFFFLEGNKKFKESTFARGSRAVFVTATSVAAIYFTQNVILLTAVYFVAQTLASLFFFIKYRPQGEFEFIRSKFDQYYSYAKHTSLRNVITLIAFHADNVIVFQQLGAAELAIYAIANIIPEQVKGLFKSVSTLITPKYSQYESISTLRKSIPKRSIQLLIISILLTAVYLLIAPILYELVFPKYHDAVFLTQLIALSIPAMVAVIPYSALQSQLKEKSLYKLNISSSIILLLLTITLIPTFGLVGAVAAKITHRYINMALGYLFLYLS